MPDRFATLAGRLLDAGIAPAYVRRYVSELRTHEADLRDDLMARGWRFADASVEARRRLGSLNALARPVLDNPRFRSKARQNPLLYFVILPLAAQLAAIALTLLGLRSLSGLHPHGAPLDNLVQALSFLWLALPAAATWIALVAARRRRIAWHWPTLGALVSAAAIAAAHLQAVLPETPGTGVIALSVSLPDPALLAALLSASLLPLLRKDAHP